MFHDRFPDFVDEVREHLAAPLVRPHTTKPHIASSRVLCVDLFDFCTQEGGGESFEETVRKLVEDEPIVRY